MEETRERGLVDPEKTLPPKAQVGTCFWELHFRSDQQKETQKGGKGGCLNPQTSCQFPGTLPPPAPSILNRQCLGGNLNA